MTLRTVSAIVTCYGWHVGGTATFLSSPYGIIRFSRYMVTRYGFYDTPTLLNHQCHYRTQLACSLVWKTVKIEALGSCQTLVTQLRKLQISLQLSFSLLRTVTHKNIPHVTIVRSLPHTRFPTNPGHRQLKF
jgi:hypothetical protein